MDKDKKFFEPIFESIDKLAPYPSKEEWASCGIYFIHDEDED